MAFGAALFRRLFRVLVVFVSAVLAAVLLVPAGPALAEEAGPQLLSLERTSPAVITAGNNATFAFKASEPVTSVDLVVRDKTGTRAGYWESRTPSIEGTVQLPIEADSWPSGSVKAEWVTVVTPDHRYTTYWPGPTTGSLGDLSRLDFQVDNPDVVFEEPSVTAMSPVTATVAPGQTASVNFTLSQAASEVRFAYTDESLVTGFELSWDGTVPKGPFSATASAPVTASKPSGKYTLQSIRITYLGDRSTVTYHRDGRIQRTLQPAPSPLPPIDFNKATFLVDNPAVLLQPQVNTVKPSISGPLAFPISTLTADPGSWSEQPTAYRYQWLRNGVPIAGATEQVYDSHYWNDGGSKVSVRVTALRAGRFPASLTTAAVGPMPRDISVQNAEIDGDVSVGGAIFAKWFTVRSFPQGGPPSFKYVWKRDGKPILRATQRSYVLTTADKGHRITVDIHVTVSGQTNIFPVALKPRIANRDKTKGLNGDNTMDVFARDNAGTLYLYPTNGRGSWLPRQRIGGGWNIYNALLSAGDWNGDGKNDVIARDRQGRLFLYPGNGKGGIPTKVQIGTGWNIHRNIIAPGDWDGDGLNDLIARDTSNTVWLYPGNGRGGWLQRKVISRGWGDFNLLLAPGKFWGYNRNEVMARDDTGNLRLIYSTGTGHFGAGTPDFFTASFWGWEVFSRICASGDFNGDGKVDVYGITPTGTMWMYFGNGDPNANVRFKGRAVVGGGWNQFSAVF
ncbi:FG-GAP-like repeat-containing protein [Arthrobacter celericrescens]|uniref:FG-GAP-like repeat-containing protein n=1 Tax=Arthrobacter celericrescens TaxID=2320851 RepID=UPI001FE0C653|nr:FG-GAP-like repeat-containing protein [Arthrobacter celericrescens]